MLFVVVFVVFSLCCVSAWAVRWVVGVRRSGSVGVVWVLLCGGGACCVVLSVLIVSRCGHGLLDKLRMDEPKIRRVRVVGWYLVRARAMRV